jgi:3-dehydroquinate dehydratase/shikimate dehydrogenase
MATICVPVCVRQIDELRNAMAAASKVADIIEVRADCLPFTVPSELLQHSRDTKRTLILTLRSPEEGGYSAYDFESRRRFWTSLKDLPADGLVDWELDLVAEFSLGESAGRLPVEWSHVICSHHDFERTPANLLEIFDRMLETPAGIIKVATRANDAVDCLVLFDLLDRAEARKHKVIAVAMGQAGAMTRILGPSRGSFLTYGSLDDEAGTAPGQLTATDLRDVYRIDRIDRQTQVFGVIAHPVAHSLSPHIHNAAFAANEMNAVFIPFEVREVLPFISRMVHPKTREIDWPLKGLSVTAPHKSMVIQALDWIDPAAREIGAVNTIVAQDDQLQGYNTDAAGFIEPLRTALGSIKGGRCAVIGSGGAARACVWALKQEAADVVVLSRDETSAAFLARAFGVRAEKFPPRSFSDFDVVINATPLGTRGEHEDQSVASAQQLRGVRLAYDLVYNPSATKFLREAALAGCELVGGLEMLLAQAVEQFKLWTGEQPNFEVMRATAAGRLQSQV